MNFPEKLDEFVERGAKKYAYDTRWKLMINIVDTHKKGAASIKPIVLKLYDGLYECKAILMRQYGSEEAIREAYSKMPHLGIIVLDVLAEVEKMVEDK